MQTTCGDDAPDASKGIAVRYIHANAPSFPYATSARPGTLGTGTLPACADFDQWMYGASAGLYRYAQSKWTTTANMYQ